MKLLGSILLMIIGTNLVLAQSSDGKDYLTKTINNVGYVGVQYLGGDQIMDYTVGYERLLAEGRNTVFNVNIATGAFTKPGELGIILAFGGNFVTHKKGLNHFEIFGNMMIPFNLTNDVTEPCTQWQFGYRRDNLYARNWGFRVGFATEVWRNSWQMEDPFLFGGYATVLKRF